MYSIPKKTSQSGFTLVETLVAIAILLITIVGPMTIAVAGLRGAYFARDQLTATYLAQESMEHMFRARDNQAIASLGSPAASDYWTWYDNLDADCKNSTGCDFKDSPQSPPTANNYQFRSCSELNNCVLYDTGTFYRADSSLPLGATDSVFTRRVTIRELSPDREAEVTVVVSWDSSATGGTQQVILQSIITNQYAGI